MEGMTGRLGRLITSVCVVLYCFGTTITFFIVIGHQFDRTFSSLYGPEYILDHEVVLVGINYRLGVFGFLSLEKQENEHWGL